MSTYREDSPLTPDANLIILQEYLADHTRTPGFKFNLRKQSSNPRVVAPQAVPDGESTESSLAADIFRLSTDSNESQSQNDLTNLNRIQSRAPSKTRAECNALFQELELAPPKLALTNDTIEDSQMSAAPGRLERPKAVEISFPNLLSLTEIRKSLKPLAHGVGPGWSQASTERKIKRPALTKTQESRDGFVGGELLISKSWSTLYNQQATLSLYSTLRVVDEPDWGSEAISESSPPLHSEVVGLDSATMFCNKIQELPNQVQSSDIVLETPREQSAIERFQNRRSGSLSRPRFHTTMRRVERSAESPIVVDLRSEYGSESPARNFCPRSSVGAEIETDELEPPFVSKTPRFKRRRLTYQTTR